MSTALSQSNSELNLALILGGARVPVDHPEDVAAGYLALDDHPRAVAHIAKMSGGSQSHLMRCSDGHFYVVKFPHNPQGNRILVNELICTNLARALGLPVPPGGIVEIDPSTIQSNRITTEWPFGSRPSSAGLGFASRHPGNRTLIFNRLSEAGMNDVLNRHVLAGIFLFDLWTSNLDPREILFFRHTGERKMFAQMIDNGHCFRGSTWSLHDIYRVPRHPNPHCFSWITGTRSFEPWLSRIEELAGDVVRDAYLPVPPEWYGLDLPLLKKLLRQLDIRRDNLRGVLQGFHQERPEAFPLWGQAAVRAGVSELAR
jgi:hypothetical protein